MEYFSFMVEIFQVKLIVIGTEVLFFLAILIRLAPEPVLERESEQLLVGCDELDWHRHWWC
jgi:hypothetical protein